MRDAGVAVAIEAEAPERALDEKLVASPASIPKPSEYETRRRTLQTRSVRRSSSVSISAVHRYKMQKVIFTGLVYAPAAEAVDIDDHNVGIV